MNNIIFKNPVFDDYYKKIVIQLKSKYNEFIIKELNDIYIEYIDSFNFKIFINNELKNELKEFLSILNTHITNFFHINHNNKIFIYVESLSEKNKYEFFDENKCKILISHIEMDQNIGNTLKCFLI